MSSAASSLSTRPFGAPSPVPSGGQISHKYGHNNMLRNTCSGLNKLCFAFAILYFSGGNPLPHQKCMPKGAHMRILSVKFHTFNQEMHTMKKLRRVENVMGALTNL